MSNARRSTRFCAVPGCENTLSKFNRTAVCMAHVHQPGLCQCPQCQGQPGARRQSPVSRPGVRSVTVASNIAVGSGGVPMTRVSLPCEPWLRGDA